MDKVLCHLSGGYDSMASTLLVANTGVEFACVFFDIGQPYYMQEISAVERMDRFLNDTYPLTFKGTVVRQVETDLSDGGDVSAYIPVRNLVFGGMSANIALARGYNKVAVGNKTLEIREDDPYCFRDCSKEFYDKLSEISTFASQGKTLEFIMPLVVDGKSLTKGQVLSIIKTAGIDLNDLWSCYEAGDTPCGVCYHCLELQKAMTE